MLKVKLSLIGSVKNKQKKTRFLFHYAIKAGVTLYKTQKNVGLKSIGSPGFIQSVAVKIMMNS